MRLSGGFWAPDELGLFLILSFFWLFPDAHEHGRERAARETAAVSVETRKILAVFDLGVLVHGLKNTELGKRKRKKKKKILFLTDIKQLPSSREATRSELCTEPSFRIFQVVDDLDLLPHVF